MGKAVTILLLLFCLTITLINFSYLYINTPNKLNKKTTIILPKGSSLEDFATTISKQKLVSNRYLFLIAIRFVNLFNSLKAGEYDICAFATPKQIIHIIIEGKTVIHKLIVIEGSTAKQITEKLNNEQGLQGELQEKIEEGELLADTYFYTYADTRSALVYRMRQNMKQFLDEEWEKRDKTIPLKNKHEALIMASIIEKETALANERPRIASVFYNRMKRKMKLQSDPTVIYAITMGKFELQRELSKKDLTLKSEFNTYYIKGLPPHPIATTGKEAIIAALHPLNTEDLFFVADKNGGHMFSKDLKTHNNNVKEYRNK